MLSNYVAVVVVLKGRRARIGRFAPPQKKKKCRSFELELELTQSHMTQMPVLRGEVGAYRFTLLTSAAKVTKVSS